LVGKLVNYSIYLRL